MSKRRGPPRILSVANKRYRLVVFKVIEKYDDGTPLDCTMIKDDGVCELQGGEEFFTAYIPEVMYKPK